MNNYHVETIRSSDRLPELSNKNVFHSVEMFRVLEKVSGCTPYMIVVTDDKRRVHAHMLAILWRRGSLLPPYLFSQGRVYGEGVYADDGERKVLFPMMLDAVAKAFQHKLCLFIEFSHISSKMFGYRDFRRHGFFPISWLHIRNSLHSMSPEERLSEQLLRTIDKGYTAGIVTREAETDDEVRAFWKMLKNYYRFKFHRYIPSESFCLCLERSSIGKVFVTLSHDKVIGGSIVVYSDKDAYLWFVASKRKSHPLHHPDVMTVWHAIKSSFDRGMRHICFMNVGLPLRRSRYRDFILSFGGKQVSSYRWFHFTIGWMNKLLSWIYRE
ncbi:MAG: GNAT family N-acetyltransferase [Prevotella sp.]|nr:GNAT family N-acetyltransferase [Prevotella sp.]